MRTVLPPSRTSKSVVLLAIAVFALAGCGSGSSSSNGDVASPNGGSSSESTPADQLPECKAAFPAAFGTPDIADVRLLPTGWPAPPAGSTLCQTSETVGGSHEEADYATDVAPEEVFAAYEAALDPSYDVDREKSGIGADVLVGTANGVDFQISAEAGKFSIALAK